MRAVARWGRWVPLACLVAAAAHAQEGEPAQPEDEFFETLRVNIVNIDVLVEDKKGNPVEGLTENDFELLVDGSPVPISNFHSASERLTRVERRAAEDVEARRETAPRPARAAEPEGEQRLQLVFYIDNFNLRPTDRNRVLRGLERFVSRSGVRGAQMMLVTYDHSLHVRQPFTSDPRLIVDAAMETEELAGLATSRDADRLRALDEIDRTDNELTALSEASAYADARRTELGLPLQALVDLMEPLGGLSGRKALVYVASGLPRRAGESLFHMVESRFSNSRAILRSFSYDLTREYDRLVRAANAAGVTLYAIDAGGLASFESLSAAEGGSRAGGSHVAIDSVRRANLQAPLHQMAEGTGGMALTNTNNLEKVFGRLEQDLTHYYSLGYRAAPGDEGRYRELEVKVRRPDVRVRHRAGFRVLSLKRRLEQGLTAALTLGRQENRFDVRLEMGTSQAQSRGSVRVPLDVQIPLSRVTLVPNGEEWLGRFLVMVRATDADGDLSRIARSEPLEIRVPAAEHERALEQHVTWSVELVLRPGPGRLTVGVADLLGGDLGFMTTGLDLGSP